MHIITFILLICGGGYFYNPSTKLINVASLCIMQQVSF